MYKLTDVWYGFLYTDKQSRPFDTSLEYIQNITNIKHTSIHLTQMTFVLI